MDTYVSSLLDVARRLRAGSLTSASLVRSALERADELGFLGCYISRFDEQAIEAAVRADIELSGGTDRGVLHGIPIAIKDIIATREGPTTAQSRVLDPGWARGRDAPVVTRLRSAGAIITGKVTTMEYALGFPDPDDPYPLPRNPWNTDTWAGGSSSGCANGVAAGLFCAAIGTDTGGSIRVPSAFCGITGLMPTYGTVPTAGCVPLSYSLDRVGPMARTSRDCAALLDAITGRSPADPGSASAALTDNALVASGSLDGLVIGVHKPCQPTGAHPAVAARFQAALSCLAELGASTIEIDLPYYEEIQAVDWMTVVSEAAAYHRRDILARWQEYAPSTRLMIAEGLLISAPDFVQAQRVRRVAQRHLGTLFADVDIIATPTACVPAPAFRELFGSPPADILSGLNTSYWNPVGNPALALPMGFTAEGLPLSIQLAAAPFREDLLLAVGALYQDATDWHSRRPVPAPPTGLDDRPKVSRSGQSPVGQPGPVGRGAPAGPDAWQVLVGADLPGSDAELRALSGRRVALREMRDSLYRVADADEERPALAFNAEQPAADW